MLSEYESNYLEYKFSLLDNENEIFEVCLENNNLNESLLFLLRYSIIKIHKNIHIILSLIKKNNIQLTTDENYLFLWIIDQIYERGFNKSFNVERFEQFKIILSDDYFSLPFFRDFEVISKLQYLLETFLIYKCHNVHLLLSDKEIVDLITKNEEKWYEDYCNRVKLTIPLYKIKTAINKF